MNLECERCFSEISLENLKENYIKIKAHAQSPTYAVIKADAYGHGSVRCAKALEEVNADGFCVATAGEAIELRNAGITEQIIIIGAVPCKCMDILMENNITISLPSYENACIYAEHIRSGKIKAHIKLDTGMSRHGICAKDPKKACDEIEKIMAMDEFSVEGIFSHLCVADMPDGREFTLEQIRRFRGVNDELAKRGIKLIRHIANSAGIMDYPEARFDIARAGIILYGSREGCRKLGLKPVMNLKAQITQIKHIHEGDTVGYGRHFTCHGDRTTATISIGYADGFPRLCSGKVSVIVNGKKAPQIGNICMDISMIDITDIPDVKVGDVVTIFGSDGNEFIPVESIADASMTITHEVMTGITKRVPKVYK